MLAQPFADCQHCPHVLTGMLARHTSLATTPTR
jgi:hypothetical protein